MVDLRVNARYQRGPICGFKLATGKFVLSTLDVKNSLIASSHGQLFRVVERQGLPLHCPESTAATKTPKSMKFTNFTTKTPKTPKSPKF